MKKLELRIQEFEQIAAKLLAENSVLREENIRLKEQLEKYRHKKNSSNSSIPPSKGWGISSKKHSLREKKGNKVGGQLGHEGTTLEMVTNVDEYIKHVPVYCESCSKELTGEPINTGRSQVIDIPKITPKVIEHQLYSIKCSCCGANNKSRYPQEVKNNINYGDNIKAMIGYLNVRQYMPYKRIKEYFEQICGLKLSEGTIVNHMNILGKKAKPMYEEIRTRIEQSNWLGTDETGCKINGKNHWIWTWQNQKMTYLVVSDNRGGQTIRKEFTDNYKGILVHDCWKAHFNGAQKHQICLAHLLRELNYFIEEKKEVWSGLFKNMLLKSIEMKRNMDFNKDNSNQINQIEAELKELIAYEIETKNKKLISFKKRMTKYENWLFTFLKYKDLPFDNNGSERAIRNVKVKQKVSCQFKTKTGADTFVILRSVIDTAIKNKGNFFDAFNILLKNQTPLFLAYQG